MTPSAALKLVAKLKAAFPRANVGPDTLQVYAESLLDIDQGVAEDATLGLIATSRFFPTIAEIRERVAVSQTQLDDAGTAWRNVLRVVSRWGRYNQTAAMGALDPLTAHAAQSVGWIAICNSTGPAERAHFLRVYDVQRARVLEGTQSLPMLEAARERRALKGGECVAETVRRLVGGEAA